MIEHYPASPGQPSSQSITLANDTIELVLLWSDVQERLVDIKAPVDAWFLDGFAPSKNPQMWSAQLFEHMAKVTVKGGTVATYSVARTVCQGLEQAGFTIEKIPGFGKKRHMLTGYR
jgi:tRNA 5-methylaminomethyl-2-thiouridine biosynthesis bifunctional protein